MLSTDLLVAVEPMLCCIEQLSERIRQYDRTIAEMAEDHKEAGAILTIHGVGPLTAMAYVLTLEQPERFERSRDAGAYLGLVPREGI